MALKDIFAKFTGRRPESGMRSAQILTGDAVFSAFGENVYASDIVQMAIDAIVRLTLSHVMAPGATPQKTAAQIGGLAELMLFTRPAELEAHMTAAGSK